MATSDPVIRSLLVRPFRSADLAFNMPGVIAFHNERVARLGQRVSGFDLQENLYSRLDSPADETNARMAFDSVAIRDLFFEAVTTGGLTPRSHLLFGLRNEPLKASLDQAILQRANAFLERYKHSTFLVDRLREMYRTDDWDVAADNITADSPRSRVGRLQALGRVIRNRHARLKAAYAADPTDVKRETTSTTKTLGRQVNDVRIRGLGSRSKPDGPTLVQKPNDEVTQKLDYKAAENRPLVFDPGDNSWKELMTGAEPEQFMLSSQSTSRYTGPTNDDGTGAQQEGAFRQESGTTHREYTVPRRDNDDSLERSLVDLDDLTLMEEFFGRQVTDLATTLANELELLDLEVRKLQLNFAHTYLVAPFDGIITAVYKDLGESVNTGEAVLRLEDDRNLLLVGRIRRRGVLRVGQRLRFTSPRLFEDATPLQLDARLVVVRGHDDDNDEWDVILEAPNPVDASGNPILPINFHFDRDDTIVSII